MSWTTPRTWVVGEVVTAALLNTHLRDNMIDVDSRLDALEASDTIILVGEDTTERTTTSTSPASLSSVTGLSIPVTSGIRVVLSFAKTSGAAAKPTFSIGMTSNASASSATDTTDSANSAGSGIVIVDFAPYGSGYDYAGGGHSYFKNAASTLTNAIWNVGNARPNAVIQEVTITGFVSSSSITLKTKDLKVYEIP